MSISKGRAHLGNLDKAASFAKIATGQYTGNGAVTQAITGVGFRPRNVMLTTHQVAEVAVDIYLAWDQFAANIAILISGGVAVTRNDRIVSLDADGFTVGLDAGAGPNVNLQVYDYLCLG